MLQAIKQQIVQTLITAGVTGAITLTTPPKSDMGDFAFACFAFAKKEGKNPAEMATILSDKLNELFRQEDTKQSTLIKEVKAFGPYVNFFLDERETANFVLSGIDENYGTLDIGNGKHVMVEYGCPNPMKAFHLGHLKNLISGESVARLFEQAGYSVRRVNYQGDVGMHIAKSLWGIYDWMDQFEEMKQKPLRERVEFLGKAYAHGAARFEEHEEGKQEVIAYNDKVYEKDNEIWDVYETARSWSLEYFDEIYGKLGTCFDHLYFESETFARGVEIVQAYQEKGIFQESEGAIIFPGSKFGLHDRVFINSKGFPTYEAKELALSEMRFAQYPETDEVIHVVGKEQTEYFRVVFRAIEEMKAVGAGKEYHLVGGFLQLKGDQKMSSRTGNIITGDELLTTVEEKIAGVMEESDLTGVEKEEALRAVTAAALKYAMLRADISKDVAFDLEESISTSGDSGPYLLYVVTRIKGILAKLEEKQPFTSAPAQPTKEEQGLVMQLAGYPEAIAHAHEKRDTSIVSRYIFDLAQRYNQFYAACPVLNSTGEEQAFRIKLLETTAQTMASGLNILGIQTVDRM